MSMKFHVLVPKEKRINLAEFLQLFAQKARGKGSVWFKFGAQKTKCE